jgi:hypothetical protein
MVVSPVTVHTICAASDLQYLPCLGVQAIALRGARGAEELKSGHYEAPTRTVLGSLSELTMGSGSRHFLLTLTKKSRGWLRHKTKGPLGPSVLIPPLLSGRPNGWMRESVHLELRDCADGDDRRTLVCSDLFIERPEE